MASEESRAKSEEVRLEQLFTTPTQEAVNSYLEAHPEVTTTVQDGAITYEKLSTGLKEKCDDVDDLKEDLDENVNVLNNAIISTVYNDISWTDGYYLHINNGQPIENANRAYSSMVRCIGNSKP